MAWATRRLVPREASATAATAPDAANAVLAGRSVRRVSGGVSGLVSTIVRSAAVLRLRSSRSATWVSAVSPAPSW